MTQDQKPIYYQICSQYFLEDTTVFKIKNVNTQSTFYITEHELFFSDNYLKYFSEQDIRQIAFSVAYANLIQEGKAIQNLK